MERNSFHRLFNSVLIDAASFSVCVSGTRFDKRLMTAMPLNGIKRKVSRCMGCAIPVKQNGECRRNQ